MHVSDLLLLRRFSALDGPILLPAPASLSAVLTSA